MIQHCSNLFFFFFFCIYLVSLLILCTTEICFSIVKSKINDLKKICRAYEFSHTSDLILPVYRNTMQANKCLSSFIVWEYMLLQLSSSGTLFLSPISRQSLSIQESTKKKREPPYMLSWSFPQYSHTEEKSWSYTSQEIYNKITKRKW